MKRYLVSGLSDELSLGIGAWDDFDEAKRQGEHAAPAGERKWLRSSPVAWLLMIDGINSRITIYDRKGNES